MHMCLLLVPGDHQRPVLRLVVALAVQHQALAAGIEAQAVWGRVVRWAARHGATASYSAEHICRWVSWTRLMSSNHDGRRTGTDWSGDVTLARLATAASWAAVVDAAGGEHGHKGGGREALAVLDGRVGRQQGGKRGRHA